MVKSLKLHRAGKKRLLFPKVSNMSGEDPEFCITIMENTVRKLTFHFINKNKEAKTDTT